MEYETLDDVEIIDTTDKAVRIAYQSIEGEDDFRWIPRSVCQDGDALKVGDTDVCVADWFVEKENLPT